MARLPDRHDVFLSYSHRDGEVARALQHELERFTKPWWRPRALRVFRDQTNLTASPDLWQAVVDALGRSDWFILMASPEAAASAWVPREVEWWRTNRPVDRVLLALTDGEIAWDADDFDWGRTTALPPAIAGTFPREPLWVDLRTVGNPPRVGDLVADFAAPIMGRPKDELIGLHIRQHRRTRRLAGAVIAALSALLLVTSVAAVVAVRQRAAALTEARISLSRQLAATATTLRDTDLDVAQLLAVQAYRTDPNEQTRTALFGAVTASPHLFRFLPTRADVATLTASGDGAAVIAGLADGTVMRWSAKDGRGEAIGKLPGPVRAVAADGTARTVLASDGTSVLTWTIAGARVATAGTAEPVKAVALSPSGRHSALVTSSYSELGGGSSRYDVTVRDLAASGPARSRSLAWAPRSVALPNDAEVVISGLAGQLERLPLPSLAAQVHTAEGDLTPLGAHGFQPTLSANGAWLTFTNGGGYLPIYPTTEPYADRPARYGAGHGNHEQALAISNDGRVVAAADAGTIYLGDTDAEGVPPARAVLTGGGAVPEGGLVFLGSTGTRLASASGRHVAIWDTRQVSRIAMRTRIALEVGAFGAPPPKVALSPQGRRVAVQPADWGDLLIHDLTDGSTRGANGQFLGWGTDDDHFFLVANDGRLTERLAASPARATRTVAVYPKDSTEQPFAISPDGRTTSFLRENGSIQIRDAASSRIIGTIRRPDATSGVEGVYQDPTGTQAAAIVDTDGPGTPAAVVYDLRAGTAHLVGVGKLHAVTVTRTGLLVQRSDGDLEWWDQAGTRLRKVVHQDRSLVPTEVTQASDPALGEYLVAQRRSDGHLVVTDLKSGDVLGALELPGAALDVKVGMAFTAGDRQLISATEGGDDGQLLRWDLTPDGWISAACTSAGRTLTTAEWARLVATSPPKNLDCVKR
jgi:WD40 repeat protein